jgi:hypothetical protein
LKCWSKIGLTKTKSRGNSTPLGASRYQERAMEKTRQLKLVNTSTASV